MPKIAISIVTYNSSLIIGPLLDNIKQEYPIYICDNSNESYFYQNNYQHVNTITTGKNIGFGRGHNLNIRQIIDAYPSVEYIAIVNPDIRIDINIFEELYNKAIFYNDAAIIAPKLTDDAGNILLTYKPSIFKRNAKLQNHALEGDICAEFASGAFYFIKTEYIKKHGLFDENIFLFHEDDDLCLNVIKNRYYIVICNSIMAKHLVGKSSPNTFKTTFLKNKASTNSRIYLEKKYVSGTSAKLLKTRIFCGTLLKLIIYGLLLKKNKFYKYLGKFCGTFLS